MLFSALRPAAGGIASGMFFVIISSADASRRITSWDALPSITSPKILNRTFVSPQSGAGLAEGETGQAKPDWPASADWP